jgi:hypothetical protein
MTDVLTISETDTFINHTIAYSGSHPPLGQIQSRIEIACGHYIPISEL